MKYIFDEYFLKELLCDRISLFYNSPLPILALVLCDVSQATQINEFRLGHIIAFSYVWTVFFLSAFKLSSGSFLLPKKKQISILMQL